MQIKFLGLNKQESIGILAILGIIIFATLTNLQVSLRRARDSQRKQDARYVSDSVIAFQEKFGFYPESQDGKILACGKLEEIYSEVDKDYHFKPCEWGEESENLPRLPIDQDHDKGASYYYLSDTKQFEIFASLEGKDEPEYDQNVIKRSIKCGNRVCNFRLTGD